MLWLLGAYLEYLKLTVTRLRARDRADYLAQLSSLRLAGGGFDEFFALLELAAAVLAAGDWGCQVIQVSCADSACLHSTRRQQRFGAPRRGVGVRCLAWRHDHVQADAEGFDKAAQRATCAGAFRMHRSIKFALSSSRHWLEPLQMHKVQNYWCRYCVDIALRKCPALTV